MSLPPDFTFDPLLNALVARARLGAPPAGESADSAAAIHAAALAALVMVKLGSHGITAVVGQGRCDAAWSWCVAARQHHRARCDALTCLQSLMCESCESLDDATPDLHGCEYHSAARAVEALLLEWICAERDWLAGVIAQLGQAGLWICTDAPALPAIYPFERDFGHDVQRLASD